MAFLISNVAQQMKRKLLGLVIEEQWGKLQSGEDPLLIFWEMKKDLGDGSDLVSALFLQEIEQRLMQEQWKNYLLGLAQHLDAEYVKRFLITALFDAYYLGQKERDKSKMPAYVTLEDRESLSVIESEILQHKLQGSRFFFPRIKDQDRFLDYITLAKRYGDLTFFLPVEVDWLNHEQENRLITLGNVALLLEEESLNAMSRGSLEQSRILIATYTRKLDLQKGFTLQLKSVDTADEKCILLSVDAI